MRNVLQKVLSLNFQVEMNEAYWLLVYSPNKGDCSLHMNMMCFQVKYVNSVSLFLSNVHKVLSLINIILHTPGGRQVLQVTKL